MAVEKTSGPRGRFFNVTSRSFVLAGLANCYESWPCGC
jgi:hypothetical protein